MNTIEIPPFIKDIYDDKNRVYHTTRHLEEMFKYIQNHTDGDMSKELYYAVLFHDIVYDVSGISEKRSVGQWLLYVYDNPHIKRDLNVDKVSDMIMATRYHESIEPNINDKDTQLLLHADWNVLTLSKSELDTYEIAMHQEYLNMGGIEKSYYDKRIRFLSELSEEYPIYSNGATYIIDNIFTYISDIRDNATQIKESVDITDIDTWSIYYDKYKYIMKNKELYDCIRDKEIIHKLELLQHNICAALARDRDTLPQSDLLNLKMVYNIITLTISIVVS